MIFPYGKIGRYARTVALAAACFTIADPGRCETPLARPRPDVPGRATNAPSLAERLQGAEADDRAAQFWAGELYLRLGRRAEAERWLRRAAQQGHPLAIIRLRSLATAAETPLSSRSPQYLIPRVKRDIWTALDAAEEAATSAETNYEENLRAGRAGLAVYRKSMQAEINLAKELARAWDSLAGTSTLPLLVHEPLLLAFRQLAIEVRWDLGLGSRTTVPGLQQQPGCQSGLAVDEAVQQFGSAITDPVAPFARRGLERAALADFARRIACLSDRQVADLEGALFFGFFNVAKSLRKVGGSAVVASFARAAAPLYLIVLDARKHRGFRSLAWHWFRLNEPILVTAINRAGWATGNILYVWDRQSAGLVGFKTCDSQTGVPKCIDVKGLLASISDPAAIGRGDCALAGMLAHGMVQVASAARYVCPLLTCGAPANPVTDEEAREAQHDLATLWPGSLNDQLTQMQMSRSICRKPDDTATQGDLPYSEECALQLVTKQNTPWDTYAACMAQDTGDTSEPTTYAQFPGVPMGRGCSLFEGGGEPSWLDKFAKWAMDLGTTSSGGASQREPDVIDQIAKYTRDLGTTSSGTAQAVRAAELRAITEAGEILRSGTSDGERRWRRGELGSWAAIKGFMLQSERDFNDGKISKEVFLFNIGAATRAAELLLAKGERIECDSEMTCANSCTALGAQLVRARECTNDLLNAFSRALGRPGRTSPSLGKRKPIDIYINYGPDAGPVADSGEGACLIGDGTPARSPTACGLILCGNGLASDRSDGCQCEGSITFIRPQAKLCNIIDCERETAWGDDCQCHPFGQAISPSGPVNPPIEDPNRR